ncbi:hypothetical protein QFZ66_005766 [Streptomyces sp. B4I13]|uniref:hypothetical protein n=1 Tax=Streptomyces sp. B4I13 TaxID=3042271 RepID=UPI0027805D41|nr:hypothetical protein [Streptomyces sp. B4I13]MDQ0961888.1 hypothetical protein [Streptomyces sp. B4I13]
MDEDQAVGVGEDTVVLEYEHHRADMEDAARSSWSSGDARTPEDVDRLRALLDSRLPRA